MPPEPKFISDGYRICKHGYPAHPSVKNNTNLAYGISGGGWSLNVSLTASLAVAVSPDSVVVVGSLVMAFDIKPVRNNKNTEGVKSKRIFSELTQLRKYALRSVPTHSV